MFFIKFKAYSAALWADRWELLLCEVLPSSWAVCLMLFIFCRTEQLICVVLAESTQTRTWTLSSAEEPEGWTDKTTCYENVPAVRRRVHPPASGVEWNHLGILLTISLSNASEDLYWIKWLMYPVTLLHVSLHGQRDVVRMNATGSPLLRALDVRDDHRVNWSWASSSKCMSLMLKLNRCWFYWHWRLLCFSCFLLLFFELWCF